MAIPIVVSEGNKGLLGFGLGEVWQYRGLLYFLVWRELKVRYKQAAIGAGWAIIQPVFSVLIFTIIFGLFARIPSDGIPYPVFAFAGLMPWTYFAEAVRRSGVGLVGDSELIRKVYFPRLLIPIAMVVTPAADFLLSLLVLFGLLAWYGMVPTWHIAFLPIFMGFAGMTALAVGLWLGPMNVRYRDVMHTLPFLIQIWMYASPIVYPVSMVPERWRLVYSLNPMVGVIDGFRWAVLGKEGPDVGVMAITFVAMLGMLVGGLIFFKHKERNFADII